MKAWPHTQDAWSLANRAVGHQLIADLDAGQQASVHRDGPDLVDHHTDIGRSTAWSPNDIRFRRATVAEVARQFNACSGLALRIDDASIAARLGPQGASRDAPPTQSSRPAAPR